MNAKPTVLYNGACPLCRREIDHYRRLDHEAGNTLDFTDISVAGSTPDHLSLSEDDAKRRLHVVDADGRLLIGIPAFAAIWKALPRYRWLAAISSLPILRPILGWIYEPIALLLYRLDKRRQNKAMTEASG